MKKLSVTLLCVVFCMSFLFGCGNTEKESVTITSVASSENSTTDSKECLEKDEVKEPDQALVLARRKAIKDSLETGKGCPNCEKKAHCPYCDESNSCSEDGTCKACQKGEALQMEH